MQGCSQRHMTYESPIKGWPINQDCLADHRGHGDGAPVARILRIIAIISENEQLARRDTPAAVVIPLLVDVAFGKVLPIDINLAIFNSHLVTGQADDALDILLLWDERRVKDDDVASLRRTRAIAQAADDDIFAIRKCWNHAIAIHADAGRDGVDADKQYHRKHQGLEDIHQESKTPRSFTLWLGSIRNGTRGI